MSSTNIYNKICPICGNEFSHNKNKTCSRKCAAKLSNKDRMRPRYPCVICGNISGQGCKTCGDKNCLYLYKQQVYDKRNPSRLTTQKCVICGDHFHHKKDKNVKTCSKKCYLCLLSKISKDRQPIEYKNCPICGKQMNKSNTAKTCSKKCGQIQSKITCNERFGADYPNQNSLQFQRSKRKMNKSFVFPSGKTVTVQGYEPFVLQHLLDTRYDETQIQVTNRQAIHYIDSITNKPCVYHPDIIIPHENRIIEVKSEYTFKCDIKLHDKQKAVEASGKIFELIIVKRIGKTLSL
jgi:predicted nucleic acid-binding Zn ribbon protein